MVLTERTNTDRQKPFYLRAEFEYSIVLKSKQHPLEPNNK
jgi:hypothetical protein